MKRTLQAEKSKRSARLYSSRFLSSSKNQQRKKIRHLTIVTRISSHYLNMGSSSASPPPRSLTPSRYSPLPHPRSPSPLPRPPSPLERSPSPHRPPSRTSSRHSSAPKSPWRSPSRSPSRRSSWHISHHSSGTTLQHVSSPSRRPHSSGSCSSSHHESERDRSRSRHASRQSRGRSGSGSRRSNEQEQQNFEVTGWSPTFSRRSARRTPRSPSPNISPRSSHPSLRSKSLHQSQSQSKRFQSQTQHNNKHDDQHNSMRTGNITQNNYITQPSILAASYISQSLERGRSRERHREWARERELERAHERQLNNSHWHNLSNPTSYGPSVYGDSRNRGRREYGFGPGVMGDLKALEAGPHGLPRVGNAWNDMDTLLGTERRGRNPFRSSRRRYASGDEYVFGNSSTRGSRRGHGASGHATIATGLIELGAGVAGGYAGAQATKHRYNGTLESYRRSRPRRANRSSVQPLVELVTNRPENPNLTRMERSPSRERSPSTELARSCHRRNTFEGSPSREEFFTAYDRPRRPSRTREKDWPHFPPTLPAPPPYAISSAGGSLNERGSVAGSMSGVRGKDAVVNPASMPAVTTSKAGVSRKVSTRKPSERKESTTTRTGRSANASTDYPSSDYPMRDLPVREDYFGGASTTNYNQSHQPANGVAAAARATPTAGYMGPSQTAGTERMVETTGEGEGLRLEKTGTRMARLRARLCGGINVPAA